jgi:hypothetical protein
MGVPTSEVGYTPAMPRREEHVVHRGHVVALDQKELLILLKYSNIQNIFSLCCVHNMADHKS